MKGLKFTTCRLIYIYERKQVFEGSVTYSKVRRINRGYVTHYTIKLTLRDQDYSNMVIEEIKIILVIVVVVVFTLKTVLTSIQYLLFLTRQGKETNFRGHKLTQNKVQKNINK